MSARPDPNLLLDLTVALDRGELDSAAPAGLLDTALKALIPQARFACVYRLGERHAFVHASTTPGGTLDLDSSPIFEEVLRRLEPVYDAAGRAWLAPLHAGADVFGLLEIGADDRKDAADRIADQVRLFAYMLSPALAPSFGDDPLVLVQAQHNASQTILGGGTPVDMLRAIHTFSGGHYDNVHLALVDSTDANLLHVAAEADATGSHAVSRDARLDDYPASDRLTALEALTIQHVGGDPILKSDERARLLNVGIHALLLVPLIVAGHLTGVLEFTGSEPVVLSAARLHALRALADQIAIVLQNQQRMSDTHSGSEALVRRVRVLEALNLLSSRANVDADEAAVLADSVRSVAEALNVERGVIVLFRPGTGAALAAAYPATNEFGSSTPLEALPFVAALRLGPVVVEDATPRADRTQQYVTTLGMRAAVFQPVLVQGELAGMLALGYQRPQAITAETVETSATMAAQLGAGLQTIRLRQSTREVALQEQRVDEIVTGYQSLNTVDDLLRVTLTELSKTFGARHAAIRLASGQNMENSHA